MSDEERLSNKSQMEQADDASVSYERESFLELHWEGERFKNMQFPVSVAKELGIVESAIKSLAREIWLKKSGKQRVPRGFLRQFNLFLGEIKDGCVNTVLVADSKDTGQATLIPNFSNEFEEGADLFLKILSGLAPKDEVSGLKSLGEALSFGKTLEPDDKVKLVGLNSNFSKTVTYNSTERSRVRTKYGAEDEEISLQLLGWVSNIDEKGEIALSTYGGESIRVAEDAETEVWSKCKSWLAGHRIFRPLRIDGKFLVSPGGKINKTISFETADVAYPDEWHERVISMMRLGEGWIDGTIGDEISTKAKCVVDGILTSFFEEEILSGDRPGIYPLLRGGFQLEWDHDGIDWSIEIDNNGNSELSAFNESIDMDEEVSALQSSQETADAVVEKLVSMMAEVRILSGE